MVGQGPAGLALSRALAARGVDVVCVDPRFGAPWPATYGMWLDEAQALGLTGHLRSVSAAPRVVLSDDEAVVLPRGYACLDGAALSAAWAREVSGVAARAAALSPRCVELVDGGVIDVELVIDARGAPVTGAAQTAFGIVVETSESDDAVFMDWRAVDTHPTPSFLYALPLGGGRLLLEETVLAARPAAPIALLRARLARRLENAGVRAPALAQEVVAIPLDVDVARPVSPYAFGVRGGAVHPATGYSVARSLKDAGPVADALARALREGASTAELARAAHGVVWPAARRITRALRDRGLASLSSLDQDELRAFFRAFFALPPDASRAFLAHDAPPLAVARSMMRMRWALPKALRARVTRTSLRVHPKGHTTAHALAAASPPGVPDG